MSTMTAQLGYRHQKVQRLRRLLRRRALRETERVFVIEGSKLLAEALDAGIAVESVYVVPGADDPVVSRAAEAGIHIHEFEAGVIERVGDTVTPQPVMAVVPFVDVPLSSLAEAPGLVVLVDVRDPGNAGTMLRSAEASGIGGVVVCDGSVDLYNPKTVRSSVGSIFHVPIAIAPPIDETLLTIKELGFVALATAMDGTNVYDGCDLTRRVALLFGNEAHGLSRDVIDKADERVAIPIEGRSESLNVSMAASILCFEAARQRRTGS